MPADSATGTGVRTSDWAAAGRGSPKSLRLRLLQVLANGAQALVHLQLNEQDAEEENAENRGVFTGARGH